MQTLYGMKVVESPLVTEVPNLQLSPGFDVCSDTMRDHMNNWLLAMFGSHMPCYVFQDTIVMHPRHAAMLRDTSDALEVMKELA
jgi:hypothetical protein